MAPRCGPAAWTSSDPIPPGGSGDQHDIVRTDLRDIERDDRRATGVDARDRGVNIDAVGELVQGLDRDDGTFCVPVTRLTEMADDTLAEPRLLDAGARGVDGAGDLATRRHRQIRERVRTHLGAGTDRGVDEVHAGRLDGDKHLTGSRLRIGNVVEHEDLRSPELVLPDRSHAIHSRSSALDVNERSLAAPLIYAYSYP